jgi:hypothetical protein
LQEATNSLFALNYEPLLRAINHVLFVSNLSDATASEVSSSATQYDLARKSLSGYKIILDLIVAGRFGLPKAAELVTFGSEYNLTNHDSFIESLHDDKERNLIQQVEELSNRPDRRFFHWEIEFPEIFFGFADAEHRQLKHKDKITAGSSGFDCVIGNPPYIDSETMVKCDNELRIACGTQFRACTGNWDIFCPFVEMCVRLLRHGGFYSQIIPNKILAAEYAESLRSLLIQHSLHSLRDYSSARVFEEAAVYPVVPVVQRSVGRATTTRIELMGRNEADTFVTLQQWAVPQARIGTLPDGLWSPLTTPAWPILETILMNSSPLSECECEILGAATVGEAYKYSAIIQDDRTASSKTHFRCVNSGTIDPYCSLWGEKPTRYLKHSFQCPVISRKVLSDTFPTRFSQACAPKAIIAGMTKRLEAIFDNGLVCAGKSTTIVRHKNKLTCALVTVLLNSSAINFAFRQLFDALALQGGYLRLGPPQLKRVPIPTALLKTLLAGRAVTAGDKEDVDNVNVVVEAAGRVLNGDNLDEAMLAGVDQALFSLFRLTVTMQDSIQAWWKEMKHTRSQAAEDV